MQRLAAIPRAREDAVHVALREVFANRDARDFIPISGGVSGALIYRFAVEDRLYVLRIEPERIALADRQRGFECMLSASQVGAAPSVHHADAGTGIAIMNFVAGRPLSEHPDGPMGLANGLGALVARLQTAASFPSIGNYPDAIVKMLDDVRGSQLLVSDQWNRCAEGLERIRVALPWDTSSLVPCHNDPNPRNILFDGERLWLVDWELAFQNDRLVDLAILTTDIAEGPELEDAVLTAALGSKLTPELRARLLLIRQLTRLFYGCVVLQSLAVELPSIQHDGKAHLTPEAFRLGVEEGLWKPGSPEIACAFAKMSLTAFSDASVSSMFDKALNLVRGGAS